MTKSDRQRYDRLARIGCIAHRKLGLPWTPAEMHHIDGRTKPGANKRTIPLSPWFHRAVPPAGMRPSEARELLGPSLATDKAAFVARFGTERQLLAEVDALIASTVPA